MPQILQRELPLSPSDENDTGIFEEIYMFDAPRDERNIELNYELYAAACFLFALVPTYVQSFWSYYMYWIDEKQSEHYSPALFRRRMKRHFLFHFILPFAPVVRNYNCVKHGYRNRINNYMTIRGHLKCYL